MNFLKRALTRVKAKKANSLILFIIFIVIINLIVAGLSIENATGKASELARQKLGGTVTLEFDVEKAMEELGQLDNVQRRGSLIQREPVTVEMAEKLASLDYVSSFNYLSSTTVFTDGFQYYSNEETEEVESEEVVNQGDQSARTGMGSRFLTEISVEGTLYSELAHEFSDGSNQLMEGQHITSSNVDQPVVLIEKRIAEINEFAVGDKLNLKSSNEETVLEFEIIGIYETDIIYEQTTPFDIPIMNPYNKMYVSYQYANLLKPHGEEENQITSMDSAIYFLDDPINIAKFNELALQSGLDLQVFKLDANDRLYQQMIGPINNVASVSQNVVILVSIAGAVILALILMLNMKERTFEIGVLLSLGENKGKIVGQIFVEVLIIAVIAFSLSQFTGGWIAQTVGNNLLERETTTSVEGSGQLEESKGGSGGIRGAFGSMFNQPQVDAAPITEIDVSVTAQEMQQLGMIGLIIILLAIILPSASIFRYHPKTILTRND